MDNFKVLFAEDDEQIRNNMAEIFSLMFKEIFIAKDGKEALELYNENRPDIVVLDIEMPLLNGLEVASKIRETNKTIPIVIATAYTDTKYFLKAVELNLTAYILKPFLLDDLQRAIKKCKEQLTYLKEDVIHLNKEASYDVVNRVLIVCDKEISLTNIEMQFLEYMLKNPNRVIGYSEFEGNIWEDGMSGPAIRSLVRNLRNYIGKKTIQNISKVGYKLILG